MGFEELGPKGKKRQLRTKSGEIPAVVPAPAPAPVVETTRVRIMRRIISTKHGIHQVGDVVNLPVALARDWISMGLAEQDKMLDAAPETKSITFDTTLKVKSPTVNIKTPKLGE